MNGKVGRQVCTGTVGQGQKSFAHSEGGGVAVQPVTQHKAPSANDPITM